MVPRVQQVVDVIDAERERFERFCRSLSAEELVRPVPESTWIVQDFIAHLATIDGPVGTWFVSLVGGGDGQPGGRGAWNVDRYNDEAVAKRRELTVEQVLAEAAEQRAALVAVMARFTDAQLDGSIHFGGDSKRPPSEIPLNRYLQGWARHDVIHVTDMLKALPERRTDPVVAEWLAEPDIQTLVTYYQKAMA